MIFARFRDLGSARQVHLSMRADQLHFPRPSDGKRMINLEWTSIRYRNVISVLKNPFYAGAYIYGKSGKLTEIVDARARKTYGHPKPFDDWEVVIKDHHESYVPWAEYERNRCCSPPTPMDARADQSPAAAAGRFWPASSPADAADGDWRWAMSAANRGDRSIAAIDPTLCSVYRAAWDSAEPVLSPLLPQSSCAR
jgi:hypothetical protein